MTFDPATRAQEQAIQPNCICPLPAALARDGPALCQDQDFQHGPSSPHSLWLHFPDSSFFYTKLIYMNWTAEPCSFSSPHLRRKFFMFLMLFTPCSCLLALRSVKGWLCTVSFGAILFTYFYLFIFAILSAYFTWSASLLALMLLR